MWKAGTPLGIVTSLPMEAHPVAPKKSRKKSKAKSPSSDEVTDVLQVIVGMVPQFCQDRLNEEYAVLFRKLVEKLSRKRPSPLVRGKPNA
jgi:hypothetical protein